MKPVWLQPQRQWVCRELFQYPISFPSHIWTAPLHCNFRIGQMTDIRSIFVPIAYFNERTSNSMPRFPIAGLLNDALCWRAENISNMSPFTPFTYYHKRSSTALCPTWPERRQHREEVWRVLHMSLAVVPEP